ncbi:MAG TPA: biotin--[acetyl-CoA-carboxylase] ligase [Burkholderiales bacterium]
MSTRLEVLRALADGRLHSGADIGRRLGISRAAVSKAVKVLSANGLQVQALPGSGYRLEHPLVPLDRRRILQHLQAFGLNGRRVEVLETVGSTNRRLLAQAMQETDPSGMVCIAEVQPQGRGRQGRNWVSTAYENLMLSVAWRFAGGSAMMAGLSLAAGVAVARAVERYGVDAAAAALGLKWPNDLLCRGRKLAGLLVEVHGEASGPCLVVLGVGVNCRIAPADARRIDQPWTDLRSLLGETIDRNRLAALLIAELHAMFVTFAASGLAPFRPDWEARHLYANHPVRVVRAGETYEGVVEGIDDSGALRLRGPAGDTHIFYSGEVSLRPAP